MTSFAGLIIFVPLFERLGLQGKLQRCCRHLPHEGQYPVARLIRLLMIHLLLGFRRLRDIEYYQEDPIVRRVAGLKRLPSVPTLSRVLAHCDDRTVGGLEEISAGLVLQRLREEKLARITLDFDGSVLRTCRFAEGTAAGYNPKRKGQRSYYPLFCTIAQTGQVLGVLHRSGNVHDSHGAIAFMRQCVEAVRQALPRTKVESRMDSAFFSDAMVRALEALKIEYTISVPFERLAALKEMIEQRRIWWRLRNGENRLGYFEKRWKPQCWQHRSRFVFIAARVPEQRQGAVQLDLFEPRQFGYTFKVVVTNKTCGARKVVRFHEGRGSQEGIFGELKNAGQIDYIPARSWNANKVYLLANLLAHNCTRELQMERSQIRRHTTEKRTALWCFESWHTLRRNLLLKAGRLTRPNGQWRLTFNKNTAVEALLHRYLPGQAWNL